LIKIVNDQSSFLTKITNINVGESNINTTTGYVAILIDKSGSTSYQGIYWDITKQILGNTVKTHPDSKIAIAMWNNTFSQCSFKDALKNADECYGSGGTEPTAIVDFFVYNDLVGKGVKLIIITDGQADPSKADQLITSLPNSTLGLSELEVIVINTGGQCDRSIGVPFGRDCPSKLKYYSIYGSLESSSAVTVVDIKCFEKLQEINTIESFLTNFYAIERVIMTRLSGLDFRSTQAQDIIMMLRDTKRRIMKNEALIAESKASADSEITIGDRLWQALKASDTTTSLSILKEMWKSSPTDKVSWDVMIDILVGRIERELKDYGIDLVQTSQKRYEAAAAMAQVDPELDSSKQILCPVTLELSEFVAMVGVEGISKLDEKSFMDFFREFRGMGAVKNSEFCEQVCKLFMPALSCEAYQSLCKHNIKTHPTTRQEFGPAISLGTSLEAIKSADYAISVAMTKGRAVVNPFYLWCIISYLAEQGQLPAFAMESYAELIIAQQKVRLKTTVVPICLGLLPGEIGFKVPAVVAFWSILAAPSLLVKDMNNPMINLVWRYAPHLDYMLTMLRIAGISPPEGADKNFTINVVFLSIMRKCKEPNFRFLINGMFYNALHGETSNISKYGMTVQEYLKTPNNISISEPLTDITLVDSAQHIFPDEMQKLNTVMSLLEAAKILRFFVMKVRPDLKMSNVVIAPGFSTNVPDARLAFTTLPTEPEHLKICPATCRPFCTVMHEGVLMDWRDYIVSIKPSSSKEIINFSIYESFGKYVERFDCYPTWIDFAHWLYYSQVMHGSNHVALPKRCSEYIVEVLVDFSDIMATISPKEFIIRRAASMRRNDRRRIEQESA
jgi:hypothetical protein